MSDFDHNPKYRPGPAPYFLAALILGIAVLVFHRSSWPKDTIFVHPVDSRAFQHFQLPGTILLKRPGLYSFFEVVEFEGNKFAMGPGIPDHSCELKSMRTGKLLKPFHSSRSLSLSETDGTMGSIVWEYEVTTPGTYQFSCHHVSSDAGPQMTIAMIDDYRNRAIDKNYLKMTSLPIGLIVSGGVFLWTYLKRNKGKHGDNSSPKLS